MIEINRDNLQNAIAKSRKTRCKVRVLGWRRYEVTNPQGQAYTVTFGLSESGRKLAACDCIAGQRGLHCYHVASAAAVHCAVAAMKAGAK